jgi:hypothetical protein
MARFDSEKAAAENRLARHLIQPAVGSYGTGLDRAGQGAAIRLYHDMQHLYVDEWPYLLRNERMRARKRRIAEGEGFVSCKDVLDRR